jgi:hypothetical protein
LKGAWFQPLNLSSEKLVSELAVSNQINLCRYAAILPVQEYLETLLEGSEKFIFFAHHTVGLCTLNQVDP